MELELKGLETAIIISLFTDKRDDENIDDPRGWWGDTYQDSPIGSHLWPLNREKRTPEVLQKAEDYAREALQWMVKDGIVKTIDIVASFTDKEIKLKIEIKKLEGNNEIFQYGF